MKTGYSVAYCIRDMVNGDVDINEVRKIVGNTRASSISDWLGVADQYARTYWAGNPYLAICYLFHFLAMGMIEQPRLLDPEYGHNPSIVWEND